MLVQHKEEWVSSFRRIIFRAQYFTKVFLLLIRCANSNAFSIPGRCKMQDARCEMRSKQLNGLRTLAQAKAQLQVLSVMAWPYELRAAALGLALRCCEMDKRHFADKDVTTAAITHVSDRPCQCQPEDVQNCILTAH
jgi:hypothetical protein